MKLGNEFILQITSNEIFYILSLLKNKKSCSDLDLKMKWEIEVIRGDGDVASLYVNI